MKRSFFLRIAHLAPILLLCACGGGSRSSAGTQQAAGGGAESGGKPTLYTFSVKAVYPHDESSYTQGLYWHDGYLWEGTGQYGYSSLRQVELESGRAVKEIPLERRYFGEGIVLFEGEIFQMTWMDGKVLVYDARTLRLNRTIDYEGEMWGLTTDGQRLYMSDGSHEIHVVSPKDFRKERSFAVMSGRRPLHEINELEWIGGRIWANVYMSDAIVIIDPETGAVEGIVDMQGLLPEADRTPSTDVLNGIAYDAEGERIFVTGKCWNKLFEIEIAPK